MIELLFIFGTAAVVVWLIGRLPGSDRVLFYLPTPRKDKP